jgi:hypothetical protein
MLVSCYAAQDCLIKSNHYKQSGEFETDLDITQQKGDIFIEISGKYDFRVTHVLIEMMEAESKVNVNWTYNVKISKGSCQKYNLNMDLVKVVHRITFIHWDNSNRTHKGNYYINIRRTHTVLCTSMLPRTPMV